MTTATRHPSVTDAAIRRFKQRLHRDDADLMTAEEWAEWVDALPRDEFLAMIHIGFAEPEEATS